MIDKLLLERSDTFKYLGVTINTNMKWGDHIEEISSKINQRLDMLKRIRYLLPLKTFVTLYNSLVGPLFHYADIVWGDKYNSKLMDELKILQKKAAKIILNLPNFSSATEALNELGWCTLEKRTLYHRYVVFFLNTLTV